MTLYRVLSVAVMVGAVLAVTLPSLVPEPWRMGAAVLAFALALLAYLRFRRPARRGPGLVFLGVAFLALALAMPSAGLLGGLTGAGTVILLNAYLWKTSGKA